MSMRTLFLSLLCVLGLMGCATGDPVPTETDSLPSSQGETLFNNYCAGCHSGGGNTMNPQKPLKGSAVLGSLTTFRAYLRKPGGAMPAFDADLLPDDQAAILYEYLQKTEQKLDSPQ